MKKIKLYLLRLVTNKISPLITPMLSGIIGAAIGSLYAWLGNVLHQSPIIESFFNDVWNKLDPATQSAFDPVAIGTGSAVIIYAVIQEAINRYYISATKNSQEAINEVIEDRNLRRRVGEFEDPLLKVDGIPEEKTQMAQNKVLAAAQMAIRDRLT